MLGGRLMQKILVVEDDIDIQDILKNHLTDAGYEVVIADDGVDGIAKFDDTISLVLLDIMLPKIDGYGVCEVIRQKSQVPIIMLTALSDEENQLKGFKQQIDDYIPKPFSPKILLCKIAAILRRRTAENQNQSLLTYKELSMDVDGFHVYQSGNEVVLTSKEFALLRLMHLENRPATSSQSARPHWKQAVFTSISPMKSSKFTVTYYVLSRRNRWNIFHPDRRKTSKRFCSVLTSSLHSASCKLLRVYVSYGNEELESLS